MGVPMGQLDLSNFCQQLASQLDAAGVRRRMWACGALQDDRYCIVRDGDVWKMGFFERGRFDIHEESGSEEEAIALFIEWVSRMDRVAIQNVESTKAWMKKRGIKRP